MNKKTQNRQYIFNTKIYMLSTQLTHASGSVFLCTVFHQNAQLNPNQNPYHNSFSLLFTQEVF